MSLNPLGNHSTRLARVRGLRSPSPDPRINAPLLYFSLRYRRYRSAYRVASGHARRPEPQGCGGRRSRDASRAEEEAAGAGEVVPPDGATLRRCSVSGEP